MMIRPRPQYRQITPVEVDRVRGLFISPLAGAPIRDLNVSAKDLRDKASLVADRNLANVLENLAIGLESGDRLVDSNSDGKLLIMRGMFSSSNRTELDDLAGRNRLIELSDFGVSQPEPPKPPKPPKNDKLDEILKFLLVFLFSQIFAGQNQGAQPPRFF